MKDFLEINTLPGMKSGYKIGIPVRSCGKNFILMYVYKPDNPDKSEWEIVVEIVNDKKINIWDIYWVYTKITAKLINEDKEHIIGKDIDGDLWTGVSKMWGNDEEFFKEIYPYIIENIDMIRAEIIMNI